MTYDLQKGETALDIARAVQSRTEETGERSDYCVDLLEKAAGVQFKDRSRWQWLFTKTGPFSEMAAFTAGGIAWTLILAVAFSIAVDVDPITDMTIVANATVCDMSLGERFESSATKRLALQFFDRQCVEELSCEQKEGLADYMTEFLNPLRVESIVSTMIAEIVNLMLLQQGGIPSTTKDDEEKSRWYFGCFVWTCWMLCVAFQWAMTASSAAANVFAFRR